MFLAAPDGFGLFVAAYSLAQLTDSHTFHANTPAGAPVFFGKAGLFRVRRRSLAVNSST
jgi:hypothetical protein